MLMDWCCQGYLDELFTKSHALVGLLPYLRLILVPTSTIEGDPGRKELVAATSKRTSAVRSLLAPKPLNLIVLGCWHGINEPN